MKARPTTRELRDWLRLQQRAMTLLLGRFVRAESPSFDKSAVDRFGNMIASEWRKRGAKVTLFRQLKRGNHVRGEWPASNRRMTGQVLVLGHLDTVYDLGTIKTMPFRVARGRAWGPGTFDMKGGLVSALYSVDALSALDCLPQRRIVFLWTSDEEIGSESSRALIEREARHSDAVLVMEPAAGAQGNLKTSRKAVGEMELIVTGRAAHAGLNPGDGINAIGELAHQITRVAKWNQLRRGTTVSAGLIEGGTRTNVVPERARVVFDLRATNVDEMRSLERKFHDLRPVLDGARLQVVGGFNRPPLERKMSAALYAKARVIAEEMGFALGETSVGGGSDGNFTAALGVPTLDGLGAVGEGAHSPDENISIRSLPERAALLAGLLKTI